MRSFQCLFPLFLLPSGGVTALKGYVTGFFYLASWGPLFAILHMMLMFKGVHDLGGAAGVPDHPNVPTLFSFDYDRRGGGRYRHARRLHDGLDPIYRRWHRPRRDGDLEQRDQLPAAVAERRRGCGE